MTMKTAITPPPPPPPLRGVFVGSGSDGMSDPRIASLILEMVHRNPSSSTTLVRRPIQVLYLGTATYDLPGFAQRQTQWFTTAGGTSDGSDSGDSQVDSSCVVSSLELVHQTPTEEEIRTRIDMADILVVGGGNTLYAVDRWKRLNLEPILKAAIERGLVVAGGSAGAISWFDGGHSHSMDPDTHYGAMMQKFGSTMRTTTGTTTTAAAAITTKITTTTPDESSTTTTSSRSSGGGKEEQKTKDWKYIRVPGLGFLPGLVCPHHDRKQSNGVLRAHDFDKMLLHHHPDEVGIGIDHWAALVVDQAQDSYRVVSLEGKPGSVVYHKRKSTRDNDNGENNNNNNDDDDDIRSASTISFSADGQGVPGVWLKQVKDGKVVARALPSFGKLSDILWPAKSIVQDHDALARCRQENPDILVVGG